jgi:hypothetical protein
LIGRGDDRRYLMTRTGPGFVLGVLLGGLGGFAAGYFISRDGHGNAESSVGSIDLTPTIELKAPRPQAVPAATAEASKEKPA